MGAEAAAVERPNIVVEFLIQLGRLFKVAIVIVVGIAVGLILPTYLSDQISTWRPAGLVFGAATILTVLRDLIQTLPTAVEYVRTAAKNSLSKLFAEVAVAALGLGFAYFAAIPASESHPSINLTVGASMPPIVLNEGGSLFATYIVFGERVTALPDGDPQLGQVKALVSTLAECIQSPTDSVDLLVRAYASSKGSDQENTELYKGRGSYVAGLLTKTIGELAVGKEAQFKVELREWKSLEMMKLRRLFKDTSEKGVDLESAGALNRRAEILVRSAGACLGT